MEAKRSQAVMDAEADAQTLRNIALFEKGANWHESREARLAGAVLDIPAWGSGTAREVARAAFLAVPALREAK